MCETFARQFTFRKKKKRFYDRKTHHRLVAPDKKRG